MGIRKADLKEFIEEKARKRKDEISNRARAVIRTAVEPIIFEKYKDAGPIERLAQQLYDAVTECEMKEFKEFKEWRFNNLMSDVNSRLIGFRKDIANRQIGHILSNLLDRCTNGIMAEVVETELQLKEKLQKQIAEYQSLVKVTEEICTLIVSCRNGDTAYKRLEELGVDLSGFAVSNPNLPAIVKLSADVCVLNGNC